MMKNLDLQNSRLCVVTYYGPAALLRIPFCPFVRLEYLPSPTTTITAQYCCRVLGAIGALWQMSLTRQQ